MTANVNPDTGVRYGYVSAHDLDDEVVDDLMYGSAAVDLSYQEAREEFLDGVRQQALDDGDEIDESEAMQHFGDGYQHDEPIVEGTLEGVHYRSSWLGGALHFFILKSPHLGTGLVCSPCVPGALDIRPPGRYGPLRFVVGYTVPTDWFRKEQP